MSAPVYRAMDRASRRRGRIRMAVRFAALVAGCALIVILAAIFQ